MPSVARDLSVAPRIFNDLRIASDLTHFLNLFIFSHFQQSIFVTLFF
jgi:hypothetical protein